MKTTFKLISDKMCLTLLAVLATASAAFGQGQIASGTIIGSGSGPFSYSLTFSDGSGATSPIGSVWYSWIPGFFYLPSSPTGASAPTGWTATVSGNSVQYVASSPAYDIQPGNSLSGFGYERLFRRPNWRPRRIRATPTLIRPDFSRTTAKSLPCRQCPNLPRRVSWESAFWVWLWLAGGN